LTVVSASHENLHEEAKNSSEIKALEHLSYINACARMELLNVNSKLINYHILKKNIATSKQEDNDGNKSMDFTLTFRSDFSVSSKFNKSRRKTNNNGTDQ